MAPPNLTDARSPHMVKLWENRVLKILRLFELQRKAGTSSAIVEHYIKPALMYIPYYLDRRNQVSFLYLHIDFNVSEIANIFS